MNDALLMEPVSPGRGRLLLQGAGEKPAPAEVSAKASQQALLLCCKIPPGSQEENLNANGS